MAEFQVRKDNYLEHRTVANASLAGAEKLAPGDIVARVTRFAFTANNITYAVAGDMIGYWQFFPPGGDDADGWGLIPVWGFAEVARSEHPEISVGEKLFGYFPPATELRMTPGGVREADFDDTVAHRAQLPPIYNRYKRVQAEPGYDPSLDAERMLLWPLYATGYCLADSLLLNDWYGASQVVVLSASSKTSIGMAYALQDIPESPKVIGMTSAGNEAFVKGLEVYDAVCRYDNMGDIDTSVATVIVDMSGNSELLGALHEKLGDNMRQTVNVGLTHWDKAAGNDKIITERSGMFFAPGHIQQRSAELGAAEYNRRSAEFVRSGIERSSAWLKLTVHQGLDGLSEIYADVCGGRSAPVEGQIIEM